MIARVQFIPNDGSKPAGHLADAEVLFEKDAGAFDGLKLVGFSVWRSPDGVYVTLPARAFGAGNTRRYFDYIRAISGQHKETNRLKEFIHAAWMAFQNGA